jgi:PAS domain S-box-containing protein
MPLHGQLYGAIPFAVVLIAAAFCAISFAWDSDRRETRAMSAIFACAGLWALLDLFSQLESDPARAIRWLELMHLPPLLLGPATLSLLARMLPRARPELRSWIRLSVVWACVLGGASLVWPGPIVGVTVAPWGDWIPTRGLASTVFILLGVVPPVIAAGRAAFEARKARVTGGRSRLRALMMVVALTVVTSISTDLLLPAAGVAVPRLGALALVLAAGAMWLRVLHERGELFHTPYGMARTVLAELRDGVALIRTDGTVLSANARLAELVGRRSQELIGLPLDQIAKVRDEDVRRGVQDLESILHREHGESLPVAVSSSPARDRRGSVIGAVVVFRDLRDLDRLRRRILTSGRMAAVGELAAGIAHEVNNPVAFMRADLNLLAQRLEELEATLGKKPARDGALAILDRGPARVERALGRLDRIAEVVADVRDFAHVGVAGDDGSDPLALLEGALRLARLECGDDIEIRVRADPMTERVALGQDLKQVLLTLLRELVTASAAGGVIWVELARQDDGLRLRLRSDRLAEPAARLIGRFERARAGARAELHGDLGVAIAFELIDRMQGGVEVHESGQGGLELALRLPFAKE